MKTKAKNKGMKLGDKEPVPTVMVLKNLAGPGSCDLEYIKRIECRTVNTHLDIKATGEDVECGLDRGLRCFGSCSDYEIRVYCDCGDEIDISTMATPTKIPSKLVQHPTKCDPAIPHVEYPNDCYKFLHCQPMPNGNWEYVEKTCGPTMMFNPVAMVCDWIYSVVAMKPWCGEKEPNEVDVFTHPTPTKTQSTPSKYVQHPTTVVVPIPSKSLVNTKCDPAIPHIEYPGDCYKFLHCQPMANGNWEYVEKTCGPTMMFNPVAMVCDWIYSVVAMKPWCGEPAPSKCPQGEMWSDCAVPCGKACHYFSKDLIRKGMCSHGANVCEEGCVDSTRALSCPPRHLWRDNKICVGLADCPCMSNDGSLVMPGATYKESDCEVCQCIDSSYICDASFCEKKTGGLTHIEDFDVKHTKCKS